MPPKVITFYVKDVYGKPLEYVVNQFDATLIAKLTGQKTINPSVRGLITQISEGRIEFTQVMRPPA